MIINRRYDFLSEPKDIRFRIRWNGKTVSICINLKIDKNKWSKSQRCNKNTWHNNRPASEINDTLNEYERKTDEIFSSFESRGVVPTADELRKELNRVFRGKTETDKTIFHFWDIFVSEQSKVNGWSETTIKSFGSVRNRLSRYKSDWTYNDLTDVKLESFVANQVEIGYKNTTIKKTLSLLQWFIRWSERKGLYYGTALKTFKPRLKGVTDRTHTIIYLTFEELMKLYSYPFDQRYKKDVRDVFCFCCFTGLRYSDVAKLKASDCKDGYINVVTQKTADAIRIELNKYSREILERYKYGHKKDDVILPVISNQKYNKYLKEIGREIGLNDSVKYVYYVGGTRHEESKPKWELLTTHCARRTFVVTALTLGIAPTTIMSWTGHADIESMKPYMAIADDLKIKEMQKFDETTVGPNVGPKGV